MLTIEPPTTPTMLAWVHGEADPWPAAADGFYEEPVRSWIAGEVADHDARMAQTADKAFGLLWIPDPASGQVKGAGWVEMIRREPDVDIDSFLTMVSRVPRERGVKITHNLVSPIFELPAGPAALHEIAQHRKRPPSTQHTRRLWVFPQGLDAFGATLIYQDGADADAAVDALAEFVVTTSVETDSPA